MKEIETNKCIVLRTSKRSVLVAVNGENQWIDWDRLVAATRQEDQDLARVYQQILRDAHKLAADGPVVVSVGQDATAVWWVCSVTAAHGGGEANWPRAADEGCTLPNQMLAACEAIEICKRLGERVVRRVGFDGSEPARAAKIVARK